MACSSTERRRNSLLVLNKYAKIKMRRRRFQCSVKPEFVSEAMTKDSDDEDLLGNDSDNIMEVDDKGSVIAPQMDFEQATAEGRVLNVQTFGGHYSEPKGADQIQPLYMIGAFKGSSSHRF